MSDGTLAPAQHEFRKAILIAAVGQWISQNAMNADKKKWEIPDFLTRAEDLAATFAMMWHWT